MAVKLDLKDKKLLFELDMDARASYSRLARRVGLSKQGVEYKMRRLEEKGVILGYYPVINVPKLGYLYCRLGLALQNVTKEKQNAIVKELVADKRFFWVFTVQGPYDILLVMWAKSIIDFQRTIHELAARYGPYLKKKNASITTDVAHYQHRYLLGTHQTKEIHIRETNEHVTIDETDEAILHALADEARGSLVTLGQRLDLHPKVVAYRILQMEKRGIIEGYRCIINHEALGRTYFKIWCNLHNLSEETYSAIKEWVKRNPLTIYLVEGIGMPEDLDFEVMVGSAQELYRMMRDLKHAFPETISDYSTMIFIKTEKVKYWPF